MHDVRAARLRRRHGGGRGAHDHEQDDDGPVSAPSPLVHLAVAGGVGHVELDSPRNRNALSVQLTTELLRALEQVVADDSVRVVVLAATGPVFCSGVDLREQRSRDADGRLPVEPPVAEVLAALWDSPKPVVARVQGPARAGGLGLVGACDVAVAAASATFAFPEVRLGVVPAMISTTCLPRMTPRAGLELFLTGEAFDAARAAEVGLLNVAVPDAELDAAVDGYTGMLLLGGPQALALTKDVVRRVPALPLHEAMAEMAALSRERFASDEGREGMRAFAEKRPPSWAAAEQR